MLRLLGRAAAAGAATAALATRASSSEAAPAADDTARLRRQSTRPSAYAAGQAFVIVRVPQLLGGILDVGHISVLVKNHDGQLASLGFYAKGYRRGLARSMLSRDDGVLVSPDPLYLRATKDPRLKPHITPLYSGALSAAQAERLNVWTDDEQAKVLELTHFTTSAGEARESAVARLDGERYVGAAMLLRGENCATWVEEHFPGCIRCTLGLPWFCRPIEPARAGP